MVLELGKTTKILQNSYIVDGFSSTSTVSSNSYIWDIGFYKQSDSKWKDLPLTPFYNTGTTIGTHGCAITSFGNILTAIKNTGYTPPTVSSKNITDSSGNFIYSVAAELWNVSYVGSVHTTVSDSYAKQYILGTLSIGMPVMVGLTKNGSTHFVSAYGYDGIKYFISDPSTYYGKDDLDDYLSSGWTVHRLKVYDY